MSTYTIVLAVVISFCLLCCGKTKLSSKIHFIHANIWPCFVCSVLSRCPPPAGSRKSLSLVSLSVRSENISLPHTSPFYNYSIWKEQEYNAYNQAILYLVYVVRRWHNEPVIYIRYLNSESQWPLSPVNWWQRPFHRRSYGILSSRTQQAATRPLKWPFHKQRSFLYR